MVPQVFRIARKSARACQLLVGNNAGRNYIESPGIVIVVQVVSGKCSLIPDPAVSKALQQQCETLYAHN
jgi:hypothetical protein